MLYLFDLDGTLISGYMDTPTKDYTDWHVLPGRREVLRRLMDAGHILAIVTNQRGVAFGYITVEQVAAKVEDALDQLGINDRNDGSNMDVAFLPKVQVYCCAHDVRGKSPWNDPEIAAMGKPSGALLREAMADYPAAAASGVLMVGDRPEDEAAARDADVPFQWAHAFFEDAR